MIGRLTGRLAEKAPDQVLLDVGGVGYLVHIPLSTFYELPEPENPASLWIYTHVREEALALYGFLSQRERALFLLLLTVNGIGPRVALTVLSGMAPAELVDALRKQDVRRLMSVPGVGKKTAERMVLELRDKLEAPLAGAREGHLGELFRLAGLRDVEESSVTASVGGLLNRSSWTPRSGSPQRVHRASVTWLKLR